MYTLNDKIQLYLLNGKGFHSNDSRISNTQNGSKVIPPAFGSDFGGLFKLKKNLLIQTAIWYLWLAQEFVYVGDEGIIELAGQTRRFGLDFSTRYEIIKNLYLNLDLSIANPKSLHVLKNESYIPLAPIYTSVGGLSYRKKIGWNESINYRYMANRPANNYNTLIAKGYLILDGNINYTSKKWEIGLSIQNILNSKWKETQFETESQLKNEPTPITEIHFTPGTPFSAKLFFSKYF